MQAPVNLNPANNIIDPTTTFVHVLHNIGFENPDELEGRVAAWCTIYDQVKPDLIIFDHSPTAMLAARGYPARRVIIGSGFLIPPDEFPMRNIRPWVPSDQRKNEADEARVLSVMNTVMARRNLKPYQRVGELYSDIDDAVLDTFPELDHYGARPYGTYWGIRSYFKGAEPQWPPGDKKIFAYLKPNAGLDKLLAALNSVGASTILVPDHIDDALLAKHASPNLRIERRLMDLEAISRQCDLAVLNANHATVCQLLLDGVPLFMVPLTLEQTMIARAIDRTGAGALIDPHLPDEFLPKLQAMLATDRFRKGAQVFAQKYAGFDVHKQSDRLADRLEEILRPDFQRSVTPSPLSQIHEQDSALPSTSTDLDAALKQHQQGKVRQAVQIYENILRENPLHPDALHLLGVAALQGGNPVRAIELIGRATALHPTNPAFFANLAEAYRASGQYDSAVEHCLTALRLRPEYPEALCNLALALRAQGKLAAAIARFNEVLKLNPRQPQIYTNLGNTYLQMKNRAKAIECFKQCIALEPRSAEAHSNLGQCLLETGQLQEALLHCKTALELNPFLLEAHLNFGNVVRELGGVAEARRCYTYVMEKAPPYSLLMALACNNMGLAAQQEGVRAEALNWYSRALQSAPQLPQLLANYGSALTDNNQYGEARAAFERALAVDPRFTPALLGLGALENLLGRDAAAEQLFRAALADDPGNSAALVALGELQVEQGQPQAEETLRRALAVDPHNPAALHTLAVTLGEKLPDADLAVLRQTLAHPQLHPHARMVLQFALAHVLDKRKEYQGAAELLQAAKTQHEIFWRQSGAAYDAAGHKAFVDRMMAAFTPEFFARTREFGNRSPRPMFIVGLQRSGTTLVEQILASHSQVCGAGELTLIPDSFNALPALSGAAQAPHDVAANLNRETVDRLAAQHLQALEKIDAAKARIIDKLPDNYLYLGYIALLFPGAKVIHCRRDLRDVALSCWSTDFKKVRWSCTHDNIVARFAEYRRIMAHWRRTLPLPLLEIDYETTVSAPEETARRLVEFAGLQWEPSCLNFHQNTRTVRTASRSQVRQPIYQTSRERWRNYAPFLGGLFERLAALPQ